MRRAAAPLAWTVLLVGLTDLVWRQLTRVALVEAAGGPVWPSWWTLAAIALAAGWAIGDPRTTSRPRRAALFLALLAAGSVVQGHLGARLQSDGFYYYAYARSIWFDHDVDLTNDYRVLGLDDREHQHLFVPTVTGHAQTTWAIGPALLWSPFLAAGHGAALWTGGRRPGVAADGTSFPYRQAICLAGLFYGLVGLFACHAIARTVFPAGLAAAAVVGVGMGSFVLWYLVREPTMSHTVSMASVSLLVLAWLRLPAGAPAGAWALLGLAGGVMMAVRWQNAIVLLLPSATLMARLLRAAGEGSRRRALAATLAFGGAAAIGFLPQMLAWQAIYGRPIAQSPIAPVMHWTSPEIADLLWSSRNGLFATSPVIYLAAIGLLLAWRRDRRLGGAGLVVFAAMIWTNGAVDDWWGGAGYGGRRFDSVVPFFTVGLAAFGAALAEGARRRPGMAVGALLGLLVVWNASLMVVARRGDTYRVGQPVSFGDLGAAQAAVLHRALGHAPSYPANLVYAARNGVAPARYDRLRPLRFLGDPARPYGRVDVGTGDDVFLASGWHMPEEEGNVSFRWARREAGMLIPLDHPAPLRVQVRGRRFEYEGSMPQHLTLVVNGTALPARPVAGSWEVMEMDAPAPLWRAGINRVELRFSRETRPADVGGDDGRPLAAALDYVRVEIIDE